MPAKSGQLQRGILLAVVIFAGILALAWASLAQKFLLLFVSAGSIWIAILVVLEPRLRPRDPPHPGQRRRFAGIAVILGFLAFVPTWYLIRALDPSLR